MISSREYAAPAMPWQAVSIPYGEPAPKADWLAVVILYAPIISVTFISKIAFMLGGVEILISIPVIIAATLLGVFSGRLKAHPTRMPMYLGMVAVLIVEQVATGNTFSPSSLFLLITLHAAYGFRLDNVGDTAVHYRRFLDLVLLICLLGIAQYFAQFAIGTTYAYPVEHFLPKALLTKNYNCLIPLHYGSHTLKANGVFMLEPSYYSQLLATGFAMEVAGPQRLWRLACFFGGFVVAFSGTGLIMMATTVPVLMIVQKRYSLIIFAIIGAFLVYVAGQFGGLDLFAKRATEFDNPGSSGYMRYVGPWLLIDQYIWSVPDIRRWLFGLGAGMMMKTTPLPLYHVAETGWAKILIEFGLVGTVAYFGFLYTSVFRSRQPIALRVNLMTMSLLSGILDGPAHAMIISLLLWPADSTVRAVISEPVEKKRVSAALVRRPSARLGG